MEKNQEIEKLDKAFIGHPKPLFALSVTEVWERFSYYGIRPLLVLFMTATLIKGGLGLSKEEASAIAGIFGGCVYLATLPGGWIADNILGQRKALFVGSVIISLGHLCIALSYWWASTFFLGLFFIVIGSGLFKTCASIMVGMLYKQDDPRRDSGFTIFYMGVNIGAFIAPLVVGEIQKNFGYHLGFGVGGIGMLIALLIFTFKAIPDFKEFDAKVGMDKAWDRPVKENKKALTILISGVAILGGFAFLILGGFIPLNPVAIAGNMVKVILWCGGVYFIYLFFFSSLTAEERMNMVIFVILFFASAVFWSVFEQQYTTFNFFADRLTDRHVLGYEIPTLWFQSINALLIILLAPVISAFWIFLAKRNREFSSFTKFALGLIGAGLGFIVMALATQNIIGANGGVENAQAAINLGQDVILASPWWLVLSFLFLTLGELCLSPVGLSIMTKIAPNVIRSQVMALWFVSISLGNVIAGLIGGHANEENLADLTGLFYKCVWILFGVAITLFIINRFFIKKLGKKS